QFFLKLFDRDTQGRLADVTAVRSPAEMLFLRKGNDVTQLCKGHSQNLMRSSITTNPAQYRQCQSKSYFISDDAYHTPLNDDLPTAKQFIGKCRLHRPETKNAAYSRAFPFLQTIIPRLLLRC